MTLDSLTSRPVRRFCRSVLPTLFAGMVLGSGMLAVAADTPAPAAESDAKAPTTLERAWMEYRFQSFASAVSLFEKAKAEAANEQVGFAAQLGHAMVLHMDERHKDLPGAIAAYQAILAGGATGDVRLLASSLMVEAQAVQAKASGGDLTQVNADWAALVSSAPNSLLAQDALMRRTLVNINGFKPDSPEVLEALLYLKAQRAAFPTPTKTRPGLAPVMDRFEADVYFWRAEYTNARAAYERVLAIGTPDTLGVNKWSTLLFTLGRLCELYLDDTAGAGKYYRQLLEETPNDRRSFYALERALVLHAITAPEVIAMDLPGVNAEAVRELLVKHGMPTTGLDVPATPAAPVLPTPQPEATP